MNICSSNWNSLTQTLGLSRVVCERLWNSTDVFATNKITQLKVLDGTTSTNDKTLFITV